MAVNKVIYNGTTLIDLTSDTIEASDVRIGKTAHSANGDQVVGSLSVFTLYTGTDTPDASLGNDGDLYIVTT